MEIKEPAVKYYTKMSANDYLEWERMQPHKHEFVNGNIFDMAGASVAHNRILTNIIVHAGSFLKGKNCNIFPSDLKIFTKYKQSYFYPDATIVCGDFDFVDDIKDCIKNPSVIFEILSPSTEDYDTGKKLFYYMQIESLQEYIIIDSVLQHIRLGRRKPDNLWQFQEFMNEEDIFSIETIGYNFALKDIYEGIEKLTPL